MRKVHELPIELGTEVGHPARSLLVPHIVAAVLLFVAVAWLLRGWSQPLRFDDAYMFWRYAYNLREGLGISWNPDGVPVYGMTGQLWVYLLLPFTWLPTPAGPMLQLASWLTGMTAIVVMSIGVFRYAALPILRTPVIAFSAVGIPLLVNPYFTGHFTTGMDTMLSVLANAVLVMAVVRYVERPSQRRAILVGTLSFVAVLVRPDNMICALGAPALAWLLAVRDRRRQHLLGLTLLPAGLLASEALACWLYFQVPLPLSFYLKSLNSYAGFQNRDNAIRNAYDAGWCALPFIALLIGTQKRSRLGLVLAFLLPVAATALYLLTVRQVMGWSGRYYIPLIPFVVIPSLIGIDSSALSTFRGRRRAVISAVAAVLAYLALHPVMHIAERKLNELVVPAPYAVPELPTASRDALPQIDWLQAIRSVTQIADNLPRGAVIAASEVGYLSYSAPHATIIDLVGLNDTQIAIHGFSMDYLLARAPDLIWFPDADYTGLRATMFSDSRLFSQYVVIRDAFNYGVAIRRDSPFRPLIEGRLGELWPTVYPGEKLSDFVVVSAPQDAAFRGL